MSSNTTNVRLVRCPKCRGVLLELADIPMYKCGECNAVLKAKNCNEDGESECSEVLDDNPSLKDEPKHDFKIKDLDSSSEKSNLFSREACKMVVSDKRLSHEISTGEINCHEKEESSSEAGGNKIAENDNGGYYNTRSQSPDTQVVSGGSSSVYTAPKPYGDIRLQKNNSFSNGQSETSAEIASHGPKRMTSIDRAWSVETNNDSITSYEDMDEAKLSGRCRDISKSCATRNNCAYKGSDPSYGGWHDQVSGRHQPHKYKRPIFESQRVAEFINNKGEPNFKGLEREKFWSKEHYRSCKYADYDHVGPLNYRDKEFLCSSSLHSAEKLEYNECNQMELLRKVDELRDQLNRSYAHQRKAREKFMARFSPQEKQWQFYHNHKLHDQENLQQYNANYHQQTPGAFKLRRSMTHRCGCLQTSHSRVGTNCLQHANYSHSHSLHEDWRCRRMLEPPNFCCEGRLHGARPGCTFYNPYSSTSSNPQRRVCSNLPFWNCDIQPCPSVPRDIDNEVKSCHTERRHTLKRHYRPTSGGAPFIICYSCFELLHIPAEFLRSTKRCHRLRCGSCSKVLMFSLHKRIHIVPCSPKPTVPPISEVDNSHATASMSNSSHANDCPQRDSILNSKDYSTCTSCSTESEPAFVSPALPSPQINTVDKMQPLSSHTKLTEQKKKKSILSLLGIKHKSPMEVQKIVGSSSKEAKLSLGTEIGLGIGSPLHRLMGYSSPSEMKNGTGVECILERWKSLR